MPPPPPGRLLGQNKNASIENLMLVPDTVNPRAASGRAAPREGVWLALAAVRTARSGDPQPQRSDGWTGGKEEELQGV